MKLKILISFLFIVTACSEEPNFFALGKKSFSASNYSLAKNQFKMIKKTDPNYTVSQHYLNKIDSLEKLPILMEASNKSAKKNKPISPFRQNFAGTYKIEVDGVSSKEEVEVYILQADGTAEWLWVEYNRGRSRIDDRSFGTWSANEKSMSINIQGATGTITEVYELKNNTLRNNLIKKRWLKRTDEKF